MDQRDRLGLILHLSIEQRHQGLRGIHLVSGVVPRAHDPDVFLGREQIEIADDGGRVLGDRCEQPPEPVGERLDRGAIEKICGIAELGRQFGRRTVRSIAIRDRQLQIGLRGHGICLDGADRQSGQLERRLGEVLEGQPHLEQRVARCRAHRVEHLHQTLERNIGVGEGGQVTLASLAEQLPEGHRRFDGRPEDESVDEHSDHRIEGSLAATRDGCSDGDVLGTGQAREQHRECRMHHHEQRCLLATSELGESGVHVGTDGEPHGVAPETLRRWPWAIGGKHQLIRQLGERIFPEGYLLRCK